MYRADRRLAPVLSSRFLEEDEKEDDEEGVTAVAAGSVLGGEGVHQDVCGLEGSMGLGLGGQSGLSGMGSGSSLSW